MRFAPRFFVLVCMMALCLASGCSDDSSQGSKGINIFEKRPTKEPAKRIERPVSTDAARQITDALRQAGDPDKKNNFGALIHYGILLAGVAVVVAGLVYWQMRRQKKMEWEINDPMALVKELNFVHQLSEEEKRFLQEISDKNVLPSPLELFVEPKFLLEAWENDSYNSSRPMVRRLLSKLFDITTDGGETTLSAGTVG